MARKPSTQNARHVDPVISYDEAAAELGISLATLKRRILPIVPIVRISPRRCGIRASVIEQVKVEFTQGPGERRSRGAAA